MQARTIALLATAFFATVGHAARGETDFIDVGPVAIPNYIGLGIGGIPDHIGSDDYRAGVAPFGRYTWGNRYIDLQGNFLSANILDHPNLRFGPAAVLRFGRDDVDDPVVDLLPDVDHSLDLGAFVSYEIVNPQEPRDRWVFAGDLTHDVTGEHSGFTASVAARKWFPVSSFAAIGFSVATTYGSKDYMDTYFSVTPAGSVASGLAPFEADAGFRDVRISGVFVQPLSKRWVVAGGIMYKRLVGDASDTPITDDRGSADQFIFGLGAAHMF
jgi:outer membrane protein